MTTTKPTHEVTVLLRALRTVAWAAGEVKTQAAIDDILANGIPPPHPAARGVSLEEYRQRTDAYPEALHIAAQDDPTVRAYRECYRAGQIDLQTALVETVLALLREKKRLFKMALDHAMTNLPRNLITAVGKAAVVYTGVPGISSKPPSGDVLTEEVLDNLIASTEEPSELDIESRFEGRAP